MRATWRVTRPPDLHVNFLAPQHVAHRIGGSDQAIKREALCSDRDEDHNTCPRYMALEYFSASSGH